MDRNKKLKQRIVALIPLRGGSKSITLKNIKVIAGKPLAYWVCRAVSDSKLVDEIYVSTEDETIKKTVRSFGFKIKTIDRPIELATDTSSTESVMMHFKEKVNFDILVTIQATSPQLTTADIDNGLKKFINGNYDSMLSVVPTYRFFWSKEGIPLNYDYYNRPRRQDFQGAEMENGAFYITKRSILEKYHCRLGGRIGLFEMLPAAGVELDEPNDWPEVEKFLNLRESIRK